MNKGKLMIDLLQDINTCKSDEAYHRKLMEFNQERLKALQQLKKELKK